MGAARNGEVTHACQLQACSAACWPTCRAAPLLRFFLHCCALHTAHTRCAVPIIGQHVTLNSLPHSAQSYSTASWIGVIVGAVATAIAIAWQVRSALGGCRTGLGRLPPHASRVIPPDGWFDLQTRRLNAHPLLAQCACPFTGLMQIYHVKRRVDVDLKAAEELDMAAKAAGFDLPAPAALPRRAAAVSPHGSIDPSESELGNGRRVRVSCGTYFAHSLGHMSWCSFQLACAP